MDLHARRQQYTLVPLPGQQDDTSYELGRTAIAPEVIELEEVPLAIQDTPMVMLPRQSSSESLWSVASSQKPKTGQDQERSSLLATNTVERGVKRLDEFLKRSNGQFNAWSRQSRFHGWRMGVLLGSCMSAFVLCVNIGLAIYGTTTENGYQGGIADLKVGPAQEVSRWSTTFHLFINAFSTMLLAASNYTMQVLSSPTRVDIDKVHRKGQWFDLGILSFRNLRRIPRQRAALALALAFSSIPLHLFYNASVFQIATFREYNIVTVEKHSPAYDSLYANFKADNKTYPMFNGSAWRSVYDTKYVAEHGDLSLVIDRFGFDFSNNWTDTNVTDYFPLEIWNGDQSKLQELTKESWDWILYNRDVSNVTGAMPSNATIWPISAHIDSAFSQTKEAKSRLQLSLVYMLVVIACNIVKLSIMIWTLVVDRSTYIVTLGDGVVSFLQRFDPITQSNCMLGRDEMLYKIGYMPYHQLEGEDLDSHMLRLEGMWLPQRRRYFALMGKDRQIFYALLFCCVLSACMIMPFTGKMSNGYSEMRTWGTDSDDVLPFGSGPLLNAWIVNCPQIILSFCYLALNAICTSMASSHEWNNIAKIRKGLRVTKPFGRQRSTYFLQLPYRWAVPLIVTSGILHWLLSQSFFLVRLNVVDRDGVINKDKSKTACGYSRLSLLVFFAVALVLVCTVGVIGLRHMQQRIPMAASCSLVISAACHPPEDEKGDIFLKKVKWGVVKEASSGWYSHCAITAGKLRKTKIGEKYR